MNKINFLIKNNKKEKAYLILGLISFLLSLCSAGLACSTEELNYIIVLAILSVLFLIVMFFSIYKLSKLEIKESLEIFERFEIEADLIKRYNELLLEYVRECSINSNSENSNRSKILVNEIEEIIKLMRKLGIEYNVPDLNSIRSIYQQN